MKLIPVHDHTTQETILVRADLILKITDRCTYRLLEFTQGENEYVSEPLSYFKELLA